MTALQKLHNIEYVYFLILFLAHNLFFHVLSLERFAAAGPQAALID